MCMSCALNIIVKFFSLSLFYELVIQLDLQVDICILDTILMLPELGPESGALATVGEFVLCVTMMWPNSPTAMSPRMNSSENITATGLGRFVQILNKTGDQHFLRYRTILR